MRLRNKIGLAAAALFASCAVRATLGGVIETEDRDEWFSLVGAVITVDFLGFAPGEFITDQYADLGILFTDGNDSIFPNENSFPNDGVGLDGNGHINVSFDTPQLWIGVDYPGLMRIDLFSGGRLIYQSSDFLPGGAGNFAGLISSEFFDAARLIDPAGEAEIDDLHFGVPAPGTLALLALAGLFSRRRRRC